jgi:hypothetical protein
MGAVAAHQIFRQDFPSATSRFLTISQSSIFSLSIQPNTLSISIVMLPKTPPLSPSLADYFLHFVKTHDAPSPELDLAIDFVSSSVFQFAFGSNSILDLLRSDLLPNYPARNSVTNRILSSILRAPFSPTAIRISTLPPRLFAELPPDLRESVTFPLVATDSVPTLDPDLSVI